MQKSLSELTSLADEDLSQLLNEMTEPLLITKDGEPQFIAQSLPSYEAMIRRLRHLEATLKSRVIPIDANGQRSRGRIIHLRP